EVVERIELRGKQRGDERLVLLARHRRVEVVGAGAFAVARLPVELGEVERVGGEDRRDGVVEVQAVAAQEVVDGFEERLRGQRTGGDDQEIVTVEIQCRYFIAINPDVRFCGDGSRYLCRESLPIDGERVAGRHARRRAATHDQRSEKCHLLLEQA